MGERDSVLDRSHRLSAPSSFATKRVFRTRNSGRGERATKPACLPSQRAEERRLVAQAVVGLFMRVSASRLLRRTALDRLGESLDAVIVTERQGPRGAPGALCDGFAGLPVDNPVLITIQTDGSRFALRAAEHLRQALGSMIARLSPQSRPVSPPCSGATTLGACHGFQSPTCRKLLVMLGSRSGRFVNLALVPQFVAGDSTYHVLPLLPNGASVSRALPLALARLNVAFFERSPVERVADILDIVGLGSTDRRVFISYRRAESTRLADQLFDGLTRARFDVFLDRFTVEPGLDFQRRLTEELADKAMVVLLESAGILASAWTTFEVNFARQHRLGILALRLPGGTAVPALDPDERLSLKPTDLRGVGPKARLEQKVLTRVLRSIESTHVAALNRRRCYLREAMRVALLQAGSVRHQFAPDGLLVVDGPGPRHVVRLSTRPPLLGDFHIVGRHLSPASRGVVVGMNPSVALRTREQLDWLSSVSGISWFDEGRLNEVAVRIANGAV